MKNSRPNIVLSLLFLIFSFSTFSQCRTKKYIRRNKKAPTMFCDDRTVYARGLLVEGNQVFTGNSDGTLYSFNLETETVEMLFRLEDFVEMRDIERSGDFIMGIQSGETGKLVRMNDNRVIEIIEPDIWEGIFLDGMDFYNNRGFIMGDPVDGKFSLFHSDDNGLNWSTCEGVVESIKGEAGFAASGTNVQILNDSTYIFITGGEQSRFIKSTDNGKTWKSSILPYSPGEGSGAFSIHFANDNVGMIVGGDYTHPDLMLNTSFYTQDGGKTWLSPKNGPRGYRSCVFEKDGIFYCCGRNGIDFSTDNGMNWSAFANGTFYSLNANNQSLIATATEGKIQIFNLLK